MRLRRSIACLSLARARARQRLGESLPDLKPLACGARRTAFAQCVMIVSDGYATGDAALPAARWRRWPKRCRRSFCSNPMMAWEEGYEPEAPRDRPHLPNCRALCAANTPQKLTGLETLSG